MFKKNIIKRVLLLCFLLVPLFQALSFAGEIFSDFAAALIDRNNVSQDIWNGYAVKKPILIYFEPFKKLLLIDHPNPPPDFIRLNRTEFRGHKVFYKNAKFENIKSHFNIDYDFSEKKIVYWRIADLFSLELEMDIFFHENFHVFQKINFTGSVMPPPEPEKMSTKVLADYYIEDALLKRCLLSEGRELQYCAEDIVTFRERRYKNSPKELIEFEQFKERIEASAQYIGVISRLPSDVDIYSRTLLAAPTLLREFSSTGFSYNLADNSYRFYYTGAIQMIILDKLRIPWKERLQKGESIYNIFKEYFPADKPSARRRKIAETFDASELTQIAEADKAVLEEAKFSGVSMAEGERRSKLTVSVPADVHAGGPQAHSVPVSLPNGDIYYPAAWFDIQEKNNFTMTVVNLPMVMGAGKRGVKKGNTVIYPNEYSVFLFEDSRLSIKVNDREVELSQLKDRVPAKFKTLDMRDENIVLKTSRAGVLFKEGSAIRVEFNN